MIGTLVLAAAISVATPQGARLSLYRAIPPPPEAVVQAAKTLRTAWATCYLADHPGSWYQLDLVCDSVTVWPAHQRVVAILGDSSRVVCDELFAMTPPLEQAQVQLGGWATVRLNPRELWHVWRRGAMVTIVFVRFPGLPSGPRGLAIEGR